MNKNSYRITVKADSSASQTVAGAVSAWLTNADADSHLRRKVCVCIDEIVSNIVNYAYSESDGEIEIVFSVDSDLVTLSFADSGIKFNPLECSAPDFEGEPTIGGYGIFIVKKFAKNIFYKYENKKNILTVEFENKQ